MVFEEWLKQQPPDARLWPYVKHVREAWVARQKELEEQGKIIGRLNKLLDVASHEIKSLEEVLEATRKNLRSVIKSHEESMRG